MRNTTNGSTFHIPFWTQHESSDTPTIQDVYDNLTMTSSSVNEWYPDGVVGLVEAYEAASQDGYIEGETYRESFIKFKDIVIESRLWYMFKNQDIDHREDYDLADELVDEDTKARSMFANTCNECGDAYNAFSSNI